jgi:predicted dinucleotide-binding enzyme
VVTVPFKNYTAVPVGPLAGKVVIDTNNYYFERDGHFPALDDGTQTVSGALAEHLPTSRIVKAFNNIHWQQLLDDGLPAGSANRRALSIAGDDAEAKAAVTALIDSFGYDVVDAGQLAQGVRFDRDKPAYGPRATAAELRELLARG